MKNNIQYFIYISIIFNFSLYSTNTFDLLRELSLNHNENENIKILSNKFVQSHIIIGGLNNFVNISLDNKYDINNNNNLQIKTYRLEIFNTFDEKFKNCITNKFNNFYVRVVLSLPKDNKYLVCSTNNICQKCWIYNSEYTNNENIIDGKGLCSGNPADVNFLQLYIDSTKEGFFAINDNYKGYIATINSNLSRDVINKNDIFHINPQFINYAYRRKETLISFLVNEYIKKNENNYNNIYWSTSIVSYDIQNHNLVKNRIKCVLKNYNKEMTSFFSINENFNKATSVKYFEARDILYVVFIDNYDEYDNNLVSSSILCSFSLKMPTYGEVLLIKPSQKLISLDGVESYLFLAFENGVIERYKIHNNNNSLQKELIFKFQNDIYDIRLLNNGNESLLCIFSYNNTIFFYKNIFTNTLNYIQKNFNNRIKSGLTIIIAFYIILLLLWFHPRDVIFLY